MSHAPSIALTHATNNFLAIGPLKIPSVMSELLGRIVEPKKQLVYLSGFELGIVKDSDDAIPQFTLNPVDYSEATLVQYNDLKAHELELINRFCRVGEINEARIDITGFGQFTQRFLIHHLREGVPFIKYDFGSGSETSIKAIYEEAELSIINPILGEYQAMAKQIREHPLLPIQSRK